VAADVNEAAQDSALFSISIATAIATAIAIPIPIPTFIPLYVVVRPARRKLPRIPRIITKAASYGPHQGR